MPMNKYQIRFNSILSSCFLCYVKKKQAWVIKLVTQSCSIKKSVQKISQESTCGEVFFPRFLVSFTSFPKIFQNNYFKENLWTTACQVLFCILGHDKMILCFVAAHKSISTAPGLFMIKPACEAFFVSFFSF